MPYSDPMMDGATIQRAGTRALERGVRTRDAFRAVEAVATAGTQAVVMTYWNLIEHYGPDAFARDLAAAGGAGAITPDLTPDEAQVWMEVSDRHGLDRIFLVSPSSTDDRLASTVAACRGWVYATSVMGVTGARAQTSSAAPNWSPGSAGPIRTLCVGVGLGVSNGDQAHEVTDVRRRGHRRFGPGQDPAGRRGRRHAGRPHRAPRGRRRPRRRRTSGNRSCRGVGPVVTALVPLSIPSPPTGVWHVFGFPLRAYALCIIAGIIVGMVIASKRWVARGGTSESLEMCVVVGGAGRHHRRPALSRGHRLRALLRRGCPDDPDRRAQDLARRPRDLGSGGLRRAGRRTWSPVAASSPSRRCWTRSHPDWLSHRPSAGSATGSTRNCSAARPRCPGGWRSPRTTARSATSSTRRSTRPSCTS